MNMMTIYSAPGCMRCKTTRRAAAAEGVDPVMVDISADPDAGDRIRARGFSELPVVQVTDDADELVEEWSGFRLDQVRKHAPTCR